MTSPSSASTPASIKKKKKKTKKRTGAFFTLACGCKDSDSISINHTPSTTTTTTSCSSSPSSSQFHPKHNLQQEEEEEEEQVSTTSSTPSVASLLRQLRDLEQTVLSWEPRSSKPSPIHRTRSLGAESRHEEQWRRGHMGSSSDGGEVGAAGRSVAVVKETKDPVGDFRRSMVAVIVEEEIVGEDELRRLLGRFLALNDPENHHLVLRAFAAVWWEVFCAGERNEEEEEERTRVCGI